MIDVIITDVKLAKGTSQTSLKRFRPVRLS
jgi:hypothetical protein